MNPTRKPRPSATDNRVRLLRGEVRHLKQKNLELAQDIERLKAQRHETAAAVRALLNVAHDDDTDEVPF